MVFESLLVDVLNRFLGPYVKNLDASQLKVGIWGGDVVLNELELKETALEDLQLPIRIYGGYLGKLRLKIPWKNLYSAPVVAEVDGLYVLVGPAAAMKYDAEKAAQELKESKDKKLKKMEAAKKAKAKKEEQSDPGFVEKLVTQIIKNVQITVKNIHVCYEDSVTNPSSPFSCGVTLDSLFVQSTNSKYEVDGVSTDDPISLIYKLVQMNCLAVYWNSNSKLMGYDLPEDWKVTLTGRIARPDFTPTDRDYVVHPISAEAKFQMSMRPGQDMDIPQALVRLVLKKITIALDKQQYHDLMGLIESLDRNSINKNKPVVPEWDPETCRRYIELYVKKLLSKSVPKDLQAELDALEVKLDVEHINQCRQLAEDKVKEKREEEREKAAAAAEKSWMGWAASWVSSGDSSAVKPLTEEEILAEEQKLYEALEYSKNTKVAAYPEEYVTQRLEFSLDRVCLRLTTEKESIADVSTHHVKVGVALRSSAGGVGVSASVGSIDMTGLAVEGEVPQIVSTASDSLLGVNFDLKPLNSKMDKKIKVELEPIQVVYDADTVDAIIGMFLLPKDVQLQKLSADAASTLEDIKTQTREGIEEAIDKRELLDVDIALKSPYLVVPQNGTMRNSENVLVADLGSLKITSDMKPSVKDLSKEELEGAFYDRFNLSLSSVQIIVAATSEDWSRARTRGKSPFHVLCPTELDLALHKSLLPNDPKLPNFKVQGDLPELMLALSDKKTKQILKIVQSLPLPPPSLANKPRPSKTEVKAVADNTASFLKSLSTPLLGDPVESDSDDEWFDAEEGPPEEPKITPSDTPCKEKSDVISSSTKLSLKFDVHKIGIHFSEDSGSTKPQVPLLNFNLRTLSATVEQTTWEMTAGVHLDSIRVEDYYHSNANMATTPTLMLVAGSSETEEKRFLDFKYQKVKKNGQYVGPL